jgi:class 3 adenylate cyclase/pimeloyl-ACP methyl ester carboxylesterase
MELDMRYATTGDGVRIAYGRAGNGLPLVRVPNAPFSYVQLEWRQSDFFDRLCRSRMVVTFDPRGTGMSDRHVEDYSLEARILDIEAVVDSLDLESFTLHGIFDSGPLVIAYAVRHPEKVRRLILDDTFANARTYRRLPHMKALSELLPDWQVFLEHVAFTFAGYGGEDVRRAAAVMDQMTTPEDVRRMFIAFGAADVTHLLPRIAAPTLIVQHKGIPGMSSEHARGMAARIPGARLLLLEGKETDDIELFDSTLAEFLGDEAAFVKLTSQLAFRTVLFTDLVGHTEMMSRLGDDRGRDVLREHERITREVLKAHGGTEVKTMGDGFMASFGSVTKAVECAIALQKAIEAGNQDSESPLARAAGEGKGVRVRVGLNAGEPIEEDGDLFGATVILASRIAAKADGGEILVADTVRGLCSGKGFLFADRGEFVAKGFEEPVRISEVSWRS